MKITRLIVSRPIGYWTRIGAYQLKITAVKDQTATFEVVAPNGKTSISARSVGMFLSLSETISVEFLEIGWSKDANGGFARVRIHAPSDVVIEREEAVRKTGRPRGN